jgi:2-amino-4-hydroxy-6-hydroxymethyldihydropteridine diphosphokinase
MTRTTDNWIPAYIGLGSNLDDPVVQINCALEGIAGFEATRLITASPLYSNPPMGPQDQPDYVNAVAGLLTSKPAQELLELMQGLEQQMGRARAEGDRWGPRVIDLDLLIYGREQMSVPGLDLPHSGISERNFVLLPLCNIAPTLHVPGQGAVNVLTARVDGDALVKIEASTKA